MATRALTAFGVRQGVSKLLLRLLLVSIKNRLLVEAFLKIELGTFAVVGPDVLPNRRAWLSELGRYISVATFVTLYNL